MARDDGLLFPGHANFDQVVLPCDVVERKRSITVE